MALSKWQHYDTAQPLDRWLYRVLRNLWISEVRKRKVRRGEGTVPAETTNELRVEYKHEERLTALQARITIDNLCPTLRAPLLLVCEQGYTYRETSDILDIPIGTVMSRIHRARKEISETLDR